MKILISSLLIIFFIALLTSFNTPEEDILGNWISNDDELWRIIFSSDGERKDYYENILVDAYTYSITNSCNEQVLQDELFLKTIDNENDITCNILNGFHKDENGIITLSITSERGILNLFTKLE